MAGRSSGETLDPETPGPFAQDLVDVDPRGRVLLSPRIVAQIAWLDNLAKGEVLGLAVLDRPLTVRLLSFEEYGDAVLARRRQLISMIDNDPAAEAALIVLEDRYHRIRIPQDRRVTLSNLLVAHLEIKAGESNMYVERLRDEVWLLSSRARSQRFTSANEFLGGLP
jgi:hypothetical protein